MPRDGSGQSDNAIEAGHNIAHGADSNAPVSEGVDRSHKAAPAPELETGEGLRNPDGSAMTSGGTGVNAPGDGAVGSGKGGDNPEDVSKESN